MQAKDIQTLVPYQNFTTLHPYKRQKDRNTKRQKDNKDEGKKTKRQKDERQRPKRELRIATSGQFRTLAMFSPSAGTLQTCPMEKKLLDLNYICPGGMREGMALIFR